MENEINITPEEARYYQDKATLDKLAIKIATDKDLKILNVSRTNYDIYKNKIDIDELKEEVLKLIFKQAYSRASEILVDWIESHNYIYTTKDDKSSEIWFYRDGIYVPNGRSEIKEICRNILEEYYSKAIVGQVTSKIEADTFIEPMEFFKTNYKYEIPVQNGILNVLTREIKPFEPSKIFFSKMPVIYDPEKICPKIDQFLTDVLSHPDDKIVYYEIVGFGLVKEYIHEKAIMFVGDGRNGKGKSLELIKRMVGIENCVSLPLVSLVPESFSLSDLFGKLYNLAGDLSSIALKDTGMFKSLTGRDIISAKRKFLNNISFSNHAKFLFACNELPRVYDYSIGFWERWILLEFPYRFVDQQCYDSADIKEKVFWKIKDDSIIDKISTPDELSGLLNAALDGLDRLLKNKRFSYTKGTEEIKNTWIRRSDSFMAFCMDCIEEDPEEKIIKKDLRKLFMRYCKKHKIKGVSDKSIKATLQEMFGVTEEYVTIGTTFNYEHQVYAWVGIKFKEGVKI